jgi:hypothetical protein
MKKYYSLHTAPATRQPSKIEQTLMLFFVKTMPPGFASETQEQLKAIADPVSRLVMAL